MQCSMNNSISLITERVFLFERDGHGFVMIFFPKAVVFRKAVLALINRFLCSYIPFHARSSTVLMHLIMSL